MSVMSHKFDLSDAEWLASLAIQPHQRDAAAAPNEPTATLVRKAELSRNELARLLNDFLADPSVH